ncbi:PspC domain-containing protein [Roseateles sp. 22389]|uniref:PspC domain-containing protein n=1 Tax=Roseateles sp. 22389 TaxID=3453916 RepID=UPI0026227E93|nr:PspC domain-containing protein [uncultured Roseateles sp.]
MSDSEELNRLADLHQRGVLSDEEFARAKDRVLNAGTRPSASTTYAYAAPQGGAPAVNAINAFRRSRDDRWIGGVCGGLARLSGLAAWFWRIVFVALTMCAGGGMLLYFLLWIFVPIED